MAVLPPPEQRTKPKPRGVGPDTDPGALIAGKYGTGDTIGIFGAEKTMGYSLKVQASSAGALSRLYPDVVPPEHAKILAKTAVLKTADTPDGYVSPARIRELEARGGHDVIAINTAWEEAVIKYCRENGLESIANQVAAHINKIKTSADTTEAAKALQLREGLEVLADSTENLRDITLERSLEWQDVPHMDQTHLYDAVPTFAGRPFSHYAEMLQSGLYWLKIVHDKSLFAKWADVTGNYHSAADMRLDGPAIEQEFCSELSLNRMLAPAQVPGREYLLDVYFAVARLMETLGNLAHYVRMGRGDDRGIFRFPLGKKGSSGMPHKDLKGGNPDTEEQAESLDDDARGALSGALSATRMDYARDLTGSAYDRINFEKAFKCGDHAIRRLAEVMHKLIVDPERSTERVLRSYGTVTSPRFLAYLTDTRREGAMPRSAAHDLLGRLATEAYNAKKPFADTLLANEEVRKRLSEEEIRKLADPTNYVGKSKQIIHAVYETFHGKKTF
jgi:adenylosuccinate lyase